MPTIPETFTKEGRFDKNPHDFFETPLDLATACLEAMQVEPTRALDIGCGTGVWGMAARKLWPSAFLTGIDIVDRLAGKPSPYDLFYQSDYTDYTLKHDVVFGNPPYSAKDNGNLAADIVMHGIDCLEDDGRLGMLLKTEFLHSERRFQQIFKKNPPVEMYAAVQRPSFYGNGSTNTICYSFFIWAKRNYRSNTTVTRWLSWR